MTERVDRRRWSTSARGLSGFLGDLARHGIHSSSTRVLQQALRDRGIYPARDFAHRCGPVPPDVFFTYHSAQNFVEIQEIVWRTVEFAARLVGARCPDLDAANLVSMIADGMRVWVDFMFIDQGARDIRRELDVLPVLLGDAQAHCVLGERPLSRAWCCYEIAAFNQRAAVVGTEALPLLSFMSPTTVLYHGWDLVETTEADDKAFIEDHIRSAFPNGFEGFQRIMDQANAAAVLSATESNPWYPPAALDLLAAAAERWLGRAAAGTHGPPPAAGSSPS